MINQAITQNKTQQDINRDRNLEKEEEAALSQATSWLKYLPEKKIKPESYKHKLRENFSYSENNGHVNEYQKAVSNHQQNLNKPFNKIDGVGI